MKTLLLATALATIATAAAAQTYIYRTPFAADVEQIDETPEFVEGALELTIGQTASGTIVAGEIGDFWQFEVADTADIQIFVEDDGQGAGMSAASATTIYDASGERRSYSTIANGGRHTLVMNDLSGTYYVLIESFEQSGGYRIVSAVVEDIPSAMSEAQPFVFGQPASSDIIVGDMMDTWSFTLAETADAEFRLYGEDQGAGALGRPILDLLDAGGTKVFSVNGYGVAYRLEEQLPAGDYFLKAGTFPGYVGGYRIETSIAD